MNYQARGLFLILLFICPASRANNSVANAIVIDHNQRLVIGGYALSNTVTNGFSYNGFALVRLLTTGEFDQTFNPNGAVPGEQFTNFNSISSVNALAIDAQNRILAVGTSQPPVTTSGVNTVGTFNKFTIVRYNTDGSIDATFNPIGALPGGPGAAIVSINSFADAAYGVAVDSQGRIVMVGTTANGNNIELAIVRLTPTGVLDDTFISNIGMPGIVTINVYGSSTTQNGSNDTATCVAIGTDDAIFVGGYTDPQVNSLPGVDVIAAPATNLNTQIVLAKINNNGTLDQTFVNSSSPQPGVIVQNINGIDDQVSSIALDLNGNLVLGGFTTIPPITDMVFVRYSQSGTLLETVPTNVNGVNTLIKGITVDSQNRIVASGSYNNGPNLAFITARWNPNGTIDATFNPTGLQGDVPTIAGTIITNLLPPPNFSFISANNYANGVVTDTNDNIYASGFANDGSQTDFVTVSYSPIGVLNPAFNADLLQPFGTLGEVYNIFFGTIQLGNGVPLLLGGDISILGKKAIETLRSATVNYVVPIIYAKAPLITNDFQPTINGSAAPNSIITILVNDIPVGTGTADYGGQWAATLSSLSDGIYTITAVATDPLTNMSLTSHPVSLTIDTEAPAQPVIESPVRDQKVRSMTVTFQGKAKPESIVSIMISDKKAGEVIAQPSGIWSFVMHDLAEGSHTVYVETLDKAGNTSIPSEIIPFTVETGRPETPRILSPKPAAVVKKSPIMITGLGKPSTVINLNVNEKFVAPIKIDLKGRWGYELPIKDGDYRIFVTTADKKLSSEVVAFTVHAAPQAPRLKQSGEGKGLFNGKAAPGSVITLYLNNAELGKVIADETGTWSYTPPPDKPIEKGRHLLKIKVADANGQTISLVDREIDL